MITTAILVTLAIYAQAPHWIYVLIGLRMGILLYNALIATCKKLTAHWEKE